MNDQHLERCAQAGFTAIRLGACFGLHRASPDSHELDPRILERLEQVIAAATERGLAVVVANLRDPELMTHPQRERARLLAGTRQLAEAIKHHGPGVMLEPLSEPQLELDQVRNDDLRELWRRCGTSTPETR